MLDFQDVFSEGFAFDDINGDMCIDDGQMHTENLKLVGPAATVAIKGDIDLAKETQRLSVRCRRRVQRFCRSGGAVHRQSAAWRGSGRRCVLAQKLLNNPLDQMFSYEYRVTGPWADPAVERVNSRVTAMPGSADFGGDAKK